MNENSQGPKHDQPQQQPPSPGYPPPSYYYPPPYEEDELNLLDLWRVLWGSKWMIISITAIFTGISVAAALLMTPIYRSEALLAPVSEDQSGRLSSLAGQFGGLAALAGIDIGGESGSTEEAIAFLNSRVLADKFILEENLLNVLTAEDSWDAFMKKIQFWKKGKNPTLTDAYKRFNEDVRSVSIDRKTGLVTLTIEWTDPKLAADWAEKLVKRVNFQMRARAIHDAEKSLEYLNKEIGKTSAVEMHEAIYRLVEMQIKTIMYANVREEYSFKIIDPPVAAELDDEVWPLKKLMVISGCILGLITGILVAFIRAVVARNTKMANPSH